MKRNLILMGLLFSMSLASCGGAEETTDGASDSDSLATDTVAVEENTIAFDGVDAGAYTLYGHTEITPDETATLDEMFQEFESTGNFNRKVSVNIDAVCQSAGCWITFLDKEGNDIRVFFRDHFTIPIETATGTEAILYGALITDTMTVDFQKHILDDAAKAGETVAQSEYDAITEDKIELSFDCESILVKK